MRVNLCGAEKGCCPEVDVGKTSVKIGEKGNLCTLKKKEWAELKRLVKAGKI